MDFRTELAKWGYNKGDSIDVDILVNLYCVKQHVLITVDEILSMKIVRKDDLTDEYWEAVKQEIQKL